MRCSAHSQYRPEQITLLVGPSLIAPGFREPALDRPQRCRPTGDRRMSKLSPRLVKDIEQPGTYQDGRGLFLKVTASGSKSWIFRYSIHGRRRDMGVGTYPDVALKDARLQADKALLELAKGVDPLARRDEAQGSRGQRQTPGGLQGRGRAIHPHPLQPRGAASTPSSGATA